MPIYDFSKDSEKIRWLKTADKEHGKSQLRHWRNQKAKRIGNAAAEAWMLDLIEQAKENQ